MEHYRLWTYLAVTQNLDILELDGLLAVGQLGQEDDGFDFGGDQLAFSTRYTDIDFAMVVILVLGAYCEFNYSLVSSTSFSALFCERIKCGR